MSFRNTFWKLTFRLELFTHTVPLPFAVYMGSAASGLDRENQMIMLMTCFSWAGTTLLLGILWRYVFLKRIFEKIDRIESSVSPETAECQELKLSMMKYPFREAAVIVFRWLAGAAPAVFHTAYIIGFQKGYPVIQMLPFVILMIGPLSFMAYFFITENTVSELIKKSRLAFCEIPPERIPKFNYYARIILTVFGLVSMPFTLFGYILYSLNRGYFTVENPAAHIIVLAVMFSFPMLFVAYILGISVRNGISSVNDTLQQVSHGNFSVKLPVSATDDFSVQAYHLNQVISRLSSMYSEISVLNADLDSTVRDRTKSLEEAKAEMESLTELTKNINSVSSLTDIMSFVMYYLETEYQYKDFWLILPDKDRKMFYTFSFVSAEKSELRDQFFKLWQAPINEKAGIIFEVFSTQEFVFEEFYENNENISHTDRMIFKKSGWKYIFSLPLLIYGETVGIISVNRPVPPEFITENEKIRIQKFSDQIAGAVSNSILIGSMEQAKAEMESLNELTRNINSVSSLTDIMSFVMYYLETNYHYRDFWMILADREKKKFKSFSFVSPDGNSEKSEYFRNWSRSVGKNAGKIFEAFSEHKTVFCSEAELGEGLHSSDVEIMEKAGWKYLYYIPLIIYGDTIGILSINKPVPPESISEEEKGRLQKVSDQIAGAVQNAELLKEAEEAQKQVEFLNEFSKVINSAKDLDTVFQQAVKELTEKLGTDIYILQLVDKKKNELFTRCYSASNSGNFNEIYYQWEIPLVPESGSVYKTYSSKKTFYFKNNSRVSDERLSVFDRKWKNDLKLNATFQIPLLVQNEVIGIMHINRYGGLQELQKEEIRFTESLCEQLAIAVNSSFLYELTEKEREKSEKLLLNILPEDVAAELKEKGSTEPVMFDSVSVLFTDFKGFTKIAENMTPQELIKELDGCFSQFDRITERFHLEKLKTIGDSYMCAGGIPKTKKSNIPGAKNAVDAVLAALEIQSFMNQMKDIKMMLEVPYWELRLGIHSGPLVAGVIGEKKFAYDVWGDTVNTASRMESSGTPGMINISGSTYEFVKDFFDCEYRGRINAKNKGEVEMYYVSRIRKGLSVNDSKNVPNGLFWERYEIL
ncbi:MAG TPA: adenylate/guanylate cyclase domain-containing protein [Leptospiraceae bacterium]|nr:adenylate/guanylate cyclase domain-containing protein [Leptospiraceae bacterium]HNM01578.1 adenylate/guanylate cyclase domain-containing protein [Leptospiraceae bacterium]HNN03613.1 adenylate/guanylate cyclase domain-containing protein [Leptospiraceae bacterium]